MNLETETREVLRLLDELTGGEPIAIAELEDTSTGQQFIDLLEDLRRRARN